MTTASPQIPGMPCPDCGERIIVTMEQLLGCGEIICACGLILRVDTERSEDTLRGLRGLQQRLSQIRG